MYIAGNFYILFAPLRFNKKNLTYLVEDFGDYERRKFLLNFCGNNKM